MTGFRPRRPADAGDAAAFLGRVVALDLEAVVRLRGADGRVTAYARLPFGVLVSRTVAGDVEPADVTVGAADLLAGLDRARPGSAGDPPAGWTGGAVVAWPARRDVEWRAALPSASGWERLDAVPGDVVRALVRAGGEALRAVPAGAAASAGESLLDHESLTVSGAGRTAAVPLRTLTALTRMGFLGDGAAGQPGADVVAVSAAGGWIRLAAPYGSAYLHASPSLGISLR